jgi:hypothetical protein
MFSMRSVPGPYNDDLDLEELETISKGEAKPIRKRENVT